MKRVFSTKLWEEDCKNLPDFFIVDCLASWVKKCEGKTMEEMKEMGYEYLDKWFEELEDEDEI